MSPPSLKVPMGFIKKCYPNFHAVKRTIKENVYRTKYIYLSYELKPSLASKLYSFPNTLCIINNRF